MKRISARNLEKLKPLGSVGFGWISQVLWSPTGNMLAVCGGDGIAVYVDGFGGQPRYRLEGQSAPVKGVAFNPSGGLLASVGADTALRLWTLRDNEFNEYGRLYGHEGSVDDVAFSPDGSLIATASTDHTIRLWHPTTRNTERVLTGHSDEVTSLLPLIGAAGRCFLPAAMDRYAHGISNGRTTALSLASTTIGYVRLLWTWQGSNWLRRARTA